MSYIFFFNGHRSLIIYIMRYLLMNLYLEAVSETKWQINCLINAVYRDFEEEICRQWANEMFKAKKKIRCHVTYLMKLSIHILTLFYNERRSSYSKFQKCCCELIKQVDAFETDIMKVGIGILCSTVKALQKELLKATFRRLLKYSIERCI